MPACCRQPQSYGRIDMGTANCSSDVDTQHNGETPSEDDDRPGAHAWDYSLKESKDCHAAITEEDQDHRAKELPDHFTGQATVEWSRSAFSLSCHNCSLL